MNSQSNVIFAAAMIAFVIFITKRGSLQTYLSILLGTAKTDAQDSNPNITNAIVKALNGGEDVAKVKPGSIADKLGLGSFFGGAN